MGTSPEPGFGIVIFDLGGGDSAHSFVDRERWEQIVDVHGALPEDPGWQGRLNESIGWLTADDRPETHRPDGAPERRGRLIETLYAQTFVLETPKKGTTGTLLGILTLPL